MNDPRATGNTALFGALTGVASLAILLQGVWAGVFLQHDGERDAAGGAITAHSWGGTIALLLALAATAVAFFRHRARRDLWIGGLVLVVLLILEIGLGQAIRDSHRDALTVVHVPLAMLIMAVTVWLPLRARSGRAAA
jgi:hypothetical protein